MTIETMKVTIPCDIHKVWDTVTAFESYHIWCSGVEKTDATGEKQYIEYMKNGYVTEIVITAIEPNNRLELEIENEHVKEYRSYVFKAKENESEVHITSSVSSKKLSTRPVGKSVFERSYIKKEQEEFAGDLKKYFMAV